MLSKESKMRVLENFYGLDYVFFGQPLKEVSNCCPLIKEDYLSIKGALLSVFIEMLKLVEHSPEPIQEKVRTPQLLEMAKEGAVSAREAAERVVTTEKARNDIKYELKEMVEENQNVDVPSLVETMIREKAFALAVDNLLIARILSESLNMKALNTFEGRIVEDSYKVLRDNLCETANLILESSDEDEFVDEKWSQHELPVRAKPGGEPVSHAQAMKRAAGYEGRKKISLYGKPKRYLSGRRVVPASIK